MRLSLVPTQRNREELLDLHQGSLAEVRRSLHDIRRINTYLGGTRLTTHSTLQLLQRHNLHEATLLDIGTGLGDIPQTLQRAARQRNIELRCIGLDNNPRHLQIAQQEMDATSPVNWLQANAFRLPLPDQSVDVVHSSLFLHHFRAKQIVQLLREFSRVARVGWVMNDLARHGLPLWFFRTTWPIFARSYITRLDGTASIRRAYTRSEMQQIVENLPGVQVREPLPFRLILTWERGG
jgi:ubiquinone/menaquinone biosynthesis C-methylase UbiE